MVGIPYFGFGVLLFALLAYGWYALSGVILRYVRAAYPEQISDLPSSLFASQGWESKESKLIRAIFSNKSVYYYDTQMRQYRIVLFVYFILCVSAGVAYVLYPLWTS